MHMCLSVRGALKWDSRTLRRCRPLFSDDEGRHPSADEIREWLMDELAQGHEVIPIGPGCEGFDFKNGCPGHEMPQSKGKTQEWEV